MIIHPTNTTNPNNIPEGGKNKAVSVNAHNKLLGNLQMPTNGSIETEEKLPELEKENFKIDSKDWKTIVTDINGVEGEVKVNQEGDVREYLDGDFQGEQLFTKGSAIRETVKMGKSLPASSSVYTVSDTNDFEKFCDEKNMKSCGWYNQENAKFVSIADGFNLWCADGTTFGRRGKVRTWSNGPDNPNSGYSVRCLKN